MILSSPNPREAHVGGREQSPPEMAKGSRLRLLNAKGGSCVPGLEEDAGLFVHIGKPGSRAEGDLGDCQGSVQGDTGGPVIRSDHE